MKEHVSFTELLQTDAPVGPKSLQRDEGRGSESHCVVHSEHGPRTTRFNPDYNKAQKTDEMSLIFIFCDVLGVDLK